MTIYYLNPGSAQSTSGGCRKLIDHVAILRDNGFDAETIWFWEQPIPTRWKHSDIVVIPECFGDGHHLFAPNDMLCPLELVLPRGVRRLYFVQNAYLIDVVDARKNPPGLRIVKDRKNGHPYMTSPDLLGIMTESQHTEDVLRARFPDLRAPLIRTHSSGNGRNGQLAGFSYGSWPREKRIIFFGYKHGEDSKENLNAQVFTDLELPAGWESVSLNGMTDEEIQNQMRTAAIFAAPNYEEGMCAPGQEAHLSGCVFVGWPGGPTGQTEVGGPMEYLLDRSVMAEQDNVQALRQAIVETAADIDANPDKWARLTEEWATWHAAEYSRQGEIDELIGIFESFGCTREKEGN